MMIRCNSTLVSIVIPMNNCNKSIESTVQSITNQSTFLAEIELILVNDGSTDSTLSVCQQLAERLPNIIVIDKPNGGVGSARNAGIEAARGKYIAFLDSDDALLPGTLEAAVEFFDEHYDEVDLVTYPMRLYNENREWPHVREQILAETGVYDLTKLQNAFSLITNVNVIVKNNDDLPRFREDLDVHEDELFFMNILLKKQKVGFCKKGAYRYYQRPGSAISTKMHPFFQFEKNIGFWEELFSRYDKTAPLYLQASYLNEVNWKIRQDVFFPYHYEPISFSKALERIGALLDRVDDDVILTSPRSDEFYQHYLIKLKKNSALSCSISAKGFAVFDNDRFLLCRKTIPLEIIKTQVRNEELILEGVLRSLIFEYATTCQLFLELSEKAEQPVKMGSTSYDAHEGRTRTNCFRRFRISIPVDSKLEVRFILEANGNRFPTTLSFSKRANLSLKAGITSFTQEGIFVGYANNTLHLEKHPSPSKKSFSWIGNTNRAKKRSANAMKRRLSALAKKRKKPLWLYYDAPNAENGNAYHQFLHDLQKNDGVTRRYVAHDYDNETASAAFYAEGEGLIRFDSAEHRYLHINADLIVASCVEHAGWCPFSWKSMEELADMVHYKLIYLPQNVLLAHQPLTLSEDRTLADNIVISTSYEANLLQAEYGYNSKQIITSGMARLDRIELGKEAKSKVLYAPSWRAHLVEKADIGRYEAKHGSLAVSQFWNGTKSFLSDPRLLRLLKRKNFVLDIKLDPQFRVYRDAFAQFENEQIRIVDKVIETDYRMLITDYSSRSFDFAYMKRPVIYFIPDEKEFTAGLHEFRKLDMPIEEKGFGPVTKSTDGLIDELELSLERQCVLVAPYSSRADQFFFHYDTSNRERLYQVLISD